MIPKRRPITFDGVFRLFLIVVLIAGAVFLLYYLRSVLIPFAIALLLAYLIDPIVSKVQKKVHSRIIAVLITFVSLMFVFFALCYFLCPILTSEVESMGNMLSKLVNDSDWKTMAKDRLDPKVWEWVTKVINSDEVKSLFSSDNIWTSVETFGKKVLPGAFGFVSGTISYVLFFLVALATIALYFIFLLIDFQTVRDGWKSLIPVKLREPSAKFIYEFNKAMNRYFRAQALVAAIVGVLFAIGFGIIGLPMGILLGLLIGLLNMVPYLQIIGAIPAVFLAFMFSLETGGNFWFIILEVAVVFVIVQTIQDVYLVPKIMGKITGLSPAMILLSLAVWGKMLGMLGLLIALPMTCLILAYYHRLIDDGKSIADVITSVADET